MKSPGEALHEYFHKSLVIILNVFLVFIHIFCTHPSEDGPGRAPRLQARFIPKGVAQGTHEPQGNGQVISSRSGPKFPVTLVLIEITIPI